MAFTTLEQRFNEKSSEIYKGLSARLTTEGQPYVNILPDSNDSRSRIKDDTRALPFVSTQRDFNRISQFLKSSDGVMFIAKQTLLQTGNVFEDTKLFSATSILKNTVPFVHAQRHNMIISGILTSRTAGLLQNGTVTDISSKFKVNQIINDATAQKKLFPALKSLGATYVATTIKRAASQLAPQTSPNSINTPSDTSRPEFLIFVGANIYSPIKLAQPSILDRSKPRLSIEATIKSTVVSTIRDKARSALIKGTLNLLGNTKVGKALQKSIPLDSLVPKELGEDYKVKSFRDEAIRFKNNFVAKNNNAAKKYNISDGRVDSSNSISSANTEQKRLNSKFFSERKIGAESTDPSNTAYASGLTQLNDTYNILKEAPSGTNIAAVFGTDTENKVNYYGITGQQKESDIIKFMFSNIDGEIVQFRALISSVKESIKTEFNEQRYVGRTERFVTYGGAKRGVSLNFNIVAFSLDEQYGMWQRVNYLSGLAFPKSIENGFMVPPLFKVTIGGLYENQPCYLDSLDFDFLDETITYDVDREVPHSVNVSMQLSILEKRSKFYDSPFYKIVEDIAKEEKQLRG